MENRVVVLVDMDCFYCQVEEKLNPELAGKPIAVVQYNPWKGGGIIAVNYVARARGVTRHMRGDEAKEKCPEIELPSVPCHRGKADITKYRDAGKEVAKVLQKFTPLLERASIDEAYLDITSAVQERLKTLPTDGIATEMIPNTFALGYSSIEEFVSDVQTYGSENIDFDHENASMLLVGAVIVSEIRAAVYNETGYRCSAGIAHNKILAKLVCGMNKPNKQTVLPKHSVNILYKTLSLKKVKHLGGKFGDSVCEILRITKMGQLQTFTEKELQSRFDEKNGTWLYNIARGIDLEPVQAKFNAKSIGCCKQFKGKNALLHLESLTKWLKDLGDEIEDRLEKDALENNRTPKQMVVSFAMQLNDGRDTSSSRSYNFVADDELCGDMFSSKALELVMDTMEGVKPKQGEKNRKLQMPIKFLGISVGKFEDHSESKKTRKIIDFFSAGASKESTNDKAVKENLKQNYDNSVSKVSSDKEYILQKFFKVTEKVKVEKVQEPDCNTTEPIQLKTIELKPHEPVITPLDKQESFFARFLNKDQKGTEDEGRATTPVCKVVECGDNSNDTDYSSSTINNEINKSIALFEEDPQDIARVSDMRTLLNTTKPDENPSDDMSQDIRIMLPANEEVKELTLPPEAVDKRRKSKSPSPNQMETFQCEECHKVVSLQALDTHADYHLALKLREEERQIFKQEREKRTQTKVVKKQESKDSKKELSNIKDLKKEQQSNAKEPKREVNNEANTSLANFLVKIDESKPTESCAECGKRISIEKFPEHMDFHEAQKLSRELNRKPVTNNFASNSVKRKRKSISPVKKLKMPCKTIDSFFK